VKHEEASSGFPFAWVGFIGATVSFLSIVFIFIAFQIVHASFGLQYLVLVFSTAAFVFFLIGVITKWRWTFEAAAAFSALIVGIKVAFTGFHFRYYLPWNLSSTIVFILVLGSLVALVCAIIAAVRSNLGLRRRQQLQTQQDTPPV
jgi:hypothetical protein